ncbi:MAG: FtsX-like permease family protein, partial [Bacteroidales bacterium]|nr:FtsX-like permease family protein [Bacteroidales bacterium]
MLIAIVILITAWINYINLATARSMERAKDIGIRKVTGAFPNQLIRQYMMESWLVNLSAILLAIVLVLVLKPLFNRIIGESIGLIMLQQPVFWVSTFIILFLGIALSGFYPAFVMTRIKPASILKGTYANHGSAGTIRQILVVFQFAASLFLICGTFIVYKQVKFMQDQNPGVKIDRTIILKYPVLRENLQTQVAMFAENLEQETNITSATLASAVPGMEVAFFASNRLQGDGQDRHRLYEMLIVDDHFVETFGFELIAGRSFKKGFGNDRENLLINEEAMKTLGIGKAEDGCH